MAAICVFCSSSERIDRSYIRLAADVGAELARRGHTLISGGGSVSMMGAVARAARAGRAHTTGVIPAGLVALEVADHDADELVVTQTMRERKGEMDRRCDGFLALPGGLGTLEELLEIWVLRSLDMHRKPVVVLDPNGLFAPLREQVDLLASRGFVRPETMSALSWVRTVDDAIRRIEVGIGVAPSRPAVGSVEEMLEAEP